VAGRYRLDELQGRGPMSEVWRAHDRTLDRTVALKILSPTADLGRFRREAQAVAALAHENVMRVYDYGEDEAGPFMALEWLPGGTLEDRLRQGPLSPDETRHVAQGMAAGLAHLHSRDLVHRDLKPANVLFDEEGRPKLGDLGLVRSTAGSGTLTEAGTLLGTAAYISPEQAVGEPAGPASDVYSFGVILFRMLTGALPFAADDALALVHMHRHVPAPPVESLQPDAPPDLAALTAAALHKDPSQRPADGAALLAALAAAPVGDDTAATQILAAPPPREPKRFPRRAAVTAVGIVLLAVGGGALAWAVTRPDAAPAQTRSGGSAGGTQTRSHSHATQTAPPQTTSTRTHTTPTTQPTTARQTTTHRTTTPHPTTTVPTTTPTVSVPTTTTIPTGTTTPTLGGTTTTGTT
jgi:eukaryotic-like serine/threonine-protein kinase